MDVIIENGPFGKIKKTFANKYKDYDDGTVYAWATMYSRGKNRGSWVAYKYKEGRAWIPYPFATINGQSVKTKKGYLAFCKKEGYKKL